MTEEERAQARAGMTIEQADALKFAADRIRTYHENTCPKIISIPMRKVSAGWRWTPVDAAGVYVPGGTAAYPSTLLMNVIPAQVAGVERIAMVTPLTDGVLNPLIVGAADLLGIDEIYAVGGAQAIAAAYGTEHSHGRLHCRARERLVAAAKREVYGQVAIDQIAGPSEILIVADNSNNPDWVAADLLSQAEHDPSSQAILITDCDHFAQKVIDSVASQLSTLPRVEIAGASWNAFGAVITVNNLAADAPRLANALAAEHLIYSAAGCRKPCIRPSNTLAPFSWTHT